MRAACLLAFTGPSGLEVSDVPEPRPALDELLVAVSAVGANQLDLNLMRGSAPGAATSLPHIVGADPAGVVLAQGEQVQGSWAGRRVVVKPGISCGRCAWCAGGHEADCPAQVLIGVHRPGGAAQLVCVPARNAYDIGDLDAELAVAAVHSVPIALHALSSAGSVGPGTTVLVTGAGGAVGGAAVQLALDAGAHVLAASTSRDTVADGVTSVRYDGADDLVDLVRAAVPAGVDVALDGTGHAGVMSAAQRCLGWKGSLVVCSASVSSSMTVDARTLYQRRQRVIGVAGADYAEVERALRLVREGRVVPAVGSRFGLDDIRAAYESLGDRSRSGKVVVRVG